MLPCIEVVFFSYGRNLATKFILRKNTCGYGTLVNGNRNRFQVWNNLHDDVLPSGIRRDLMIWNGVSLLYLMSLMFANLHNVCIVFEPPTEDWAAENTLITPYPQRGMCTSVNINSYVDFVFLATDLSLYIWYTYHVCRMVYIFAIGNVGRG
jgi:hypothetical protein